MSARQGDGKRGTPATFDRLVAGLLLVLVQVLAGGMALAQTVTIGPRAGATLLPLLGLNVGPGPSGDAGNADLTTAYRQRGVTLVRTHDYYGPLDMATLYPDRSRDPLQRSSYNFDGVLDSRYQRSSDSVFASIVDGGFEPYFRLGDSYSNVAAPSPAERANWVEAAVQVLRHYRLGQWNGFDSGFRFVEIWNEPDGTTFWPAPRTAEEFNELYDATAKAVRAAFPTLKIGGPGWSPAGCLSPAGQSKVRAHLDHVQAQGSPLDFLSFHVYSTDAATYATCARFYRAELDSRGFGDVELHITEWNTPNGTAGSGAGRLRHNALGAAHLSAAWIELQGAGVAQSTFYRGTDPAPDSPEFYGIFYGDGRSKRIADAFLLWRDLSAYGHRLQLGGAPAGATLLAAEDDGGARALLVANPQSAGASVGLQFADGKTLADYRASVSTVSDPGSGVATSELAGAQLVVPAESTVLLRLTPKGQAFAVAGSGSGPPSAHSVRLSVSVAAADVGSSGSIFVAALLGSTWYAFDGSAWRPWTGGALPAAFVGHLPPSFAITPIDGLDVAGLSDTPIYLGYGHTADEMIDSGRYRLAYRLP